MGSWLDYYYWQCRPRKEMGKILKFNIIAFVFTSSTKKWKKNRLNLTDIANQTMWKRLAIKSTCKKKVRNSTKQWENAKIEAAESFRDSEHLVNLNYFVLQFPCFHLEARKKKRFFSFFRTFSDTFSINSFPFSVKSWRWLDDVAHNLCTTIPYLKICVCYSAVCSANWRCDLFLSVYVARSIFCMYKLSSWSFVIFIPSLAAYSL